MSRGKKWAMSLFAIIIFALSSSMVYASDNVDCVYTENPGFVSTYTVVTSEEIPDSPNGYSDWLFAGWYSNKECSTVLHSTQGVNKAWAKFVPADVLNVKCQVQVNAKMAGATNMRLVSSVDSLNYKEAGFEIQYKENGKIIKCSTSTVYERITASAKSGVDFKFSPKVLSTKSEYFITATLLDIKNSNYEEIFNIRAYWVTYDGTKVYGTDKYVTVSDSYNGVVSVPVKADAVINLTTLHVTGADVTATERRCFNDKTYANLILIVGDAEIQALPSATLFSVTDTGTGTEVASMVYRNYETVYRAEDGSAKADKTWYTVYEALGEEEFTIATSADLYGFALVAERNTKTFYVVADIAVNEEIISPFETDWETIRVNLNQWKPITPTNGSGQAFAGTFDGQGHTISGLYAIGADNSVLGLFGKTNDATIKNLQMANCYFDGSYTIGSIVGEGSGTFCNLYSKATLNAIENCGGIVGLINGNSSLEKCWYDGVMTTGVNSGGVIGKIYKDGTTVEATITNCLYGGKITSVASSTQPYVSGFVGFVSNNSTLNVVTSLSVGTISLSSSATHAWKGWAVSYTEQSDDDVTIINSYVNKNGLSRAIGTQGSAFLETGLESAVLMGDALVNATGKLDWKNIYVIRSNGEAGIRGLVNDDETTAVDTSWYTYAIADEDGNAAGTKENPYIIKDAADLYGLAQLSNEATVFGDKYIILANDIIVNKVEIDPNGEDWLTIQSDLRKWTPIGMSKMFKGNFDGQGFTISGLYAIQTDANRSTGLFGETQAGCHISNVRLTNSYFEGVQYVGGIAGYAIGTFENLYSNAVIKGDNISGGIIGVTSGTTTLTKCWFDGKLTVQSNSGGIVGNAQGTRLTLTNCLTSGDIVCESSDNTMPFVSSFVGRVNDGKYLELMTSLSVSTITMPETATHAWKGWAVSKLQSADYLTYTDSYAYMSGLDRAIGISNGLHEEFGLTEEQRIGEALKNTATNIDWKDVFTLSEDGTPALLVFTCDTSWYEDSSAGTEENPYQIINAADLYGLAKLSNETTVFADKYIVLANDIKVNGEILNPERSDWESVRHELRIWIPIGMNKMFKGNFNGQGYTISGLYAVQTDSSRSTGLFGDTQAGCHISNVRLTNSYFEGIQYVGSIAGYAIGTFENLYSEAILQANSWCGGIAGVTGGTATFEQCWFNGSLTTTINSGGIVGNVQGTQTTIENSLYSGKIVCRKADTDRPNVSGFVGKVDNGKYLTLTNDLSVGSILLPESATHAWKGWAVSAIQSSDYLTYTDTYAYKNGLSRAIGIDKTGYLETGLDATEVVYGYGAYIHTPKLGFDDPSTEEKEGAWIIREGKYPIPQTFTTEKDIVLNPYITRYTDAGEWVDYGARNYVTTAKSTDKTTYDMYLQTLEQDGFVRYDNGGDDGLDEAVFTATYKKADLVLTTTYVDKTNTAYTSVCSNLPLSEHLQTEAVYHEAADGYTGAVEDVTLHMLTLDTLQTGSSYVLQLKNGHFIVMDGGDGDDADNLISHLKALVPNGKKPIVDAWIISHAHVDHIGAISDVAFGAVSFAEDIYVEGIYFSEPSSVATSVDTGKAATHIRNLKAAAKKLKTTRTTGNSVVHPEIYRPQTGQKYYFYGNVIMDIVLTQEQIPVEQYTCLTPFYGDAFNESSTWCMFHIDGKKFLTGGDGGQAEMTFVMNAYSQSYLTVNVFTALHHGVNTWERFTNYCIIENYILFSNKTAPNLTYWSGVDYFFMQEGKDVVITFYADNVSGTYIAVSE